MKPISDPWEFFESPEYTKHFDSEVDKQMLRLSQMKLNPLERAQRTDTLQRLHRLGKYDDMITLIEETAKNYDYSLDFEVAATTDLVSLIADECSKLGQKGIVSIGCSNGLLEFRLQLECDRKNLGISVFAVDLFKGPTAFMGLTPQIHRSPYYYDYSKVIEMDYRELYNIQTDQALMMCYSHPADRLWQKYFKAYKGKCIIIIGKKYATLPYPQIFKEFPNQSEDRWVEVANMKVMSRNANVSLSIYKKADV